MRPTHLQPAGWLLLH